MDATETLVIGAGQAGLSLSRYLAAAGHEHVILERGRVGERWRSERWDSLSLLTPNWLNTLPGSRPHANPDGFLSREAFTDYLDEYARSFAAPVRDGVTVLAVRRRRGRFHVSTDEGTWRSDRVVLATGYADVPELPALAAFAPHRVVRQIHSSAYRSPQALPAGGVLVVGAGPSGQQIALELRRAGRDVVLAVGRHARTPRRYRGRDIWFWLADMGNLDDRLDEQPNPRAALRAPSLVLTGGNGGEQLDLAVLAREGVIVTGRLAAFDGARAVFADDLAQTTGEAERQLRELLHRIDAHVKGSGCASEAPPPDAIEELALLPAPASLDLGAAGITTVVWATGYGRRYDWLRLDVLGGDGEIVHREGTTSVPGLHAIGLRFQRTRKSHFIGGVGEDAELLASRIVADEPRRANARLRRMRTLVGSARSRRPGWCDSPGRRAGPVGA